MLSILLIKIVGAQQTKFGTGPKQPALRTGISGRDFSPSSGLPSGPDKKRGKKAQMV